LLSFLKVKIKILSEDVYKKIKALWLATMAVLLTLLP